MIRPYRFSCVLDLGLSKKFDPIILACILRALHLERVTKREGLEPVFVYSYRSLLIMRKLEEN
jgi:hypothetical protein